MNPESVGKIFFCGDIYIKRTTDKNLLSHRLGKIVNQCDVRCMNLEGPVVEKDFKRLKKTGPSQFQNAGIIGRIKDAGFNVAVLANNHIMDYGMQGLGLTRKELDSNGIDYTGAGDAEDDAFAPLVYNVGTVRLGIISVAECGFGAITCVGESGYAWFGSETFEDRIRQTKKRCDLLIINVHAGAEDFDYPLPEIRKLYRSFIDIGADIIIGHHPHVVQGYENYGGGVIFYSLGNFAFDESDDPEKEYNPDGLGVIIDIKNDKSFDFQLIYTRYQGGTVEMADAETEKSRQSIMMELNTVLGDQERYENIINEFCLQIYEDVYKRFYSEGVVGKFKGFRGIYRKLLRCMMQGPGFDDCFMYHNLAVETHYWIVKRASYFKLKQKYYT